MATVTPADVVFAGEQVQHSRAPRGVGALTLGTVQLGMPYGAVNDTGLPSRSQAIEIVREAVAAGVILFDTAREYGEAEEVLGSALDGLPREQAVVITKLSLSGLAPDAAEREVHARVDRSVDASCAALHRERLDVLLLHRWEHRHAWNGAAWRRLQQLLAIGKIRALGASLYEPSEALEALCDREIRHLQLPVNVLDWRWQHTGVDRALAQRDDVHVHARSVLLQGVLAHPAYRWPAIDGLESEQSAGQLACFAQKFNRESVKDFCFAYARSLGWVSSLVVGCETLPQLRENARLFTTPCLDERQRDEWERARPRVPEDFLNPSRWDLAGVANVR